MRTCAVVHEKQRFILLGARVCCVRVATERTTPGAGQKHVAATLRKQIGRGRGSTLRLAALAEVSESYGGGMRYGSHTPGANRWWSGTSGD
eukprot:COSAG01_NODE_5721_length_4076_cov_3.361076_2_plen_91_part_00